MRFDLKAAIVATCAMGLAGEGRSQDNAGVAFPVIAGQGELITATASLSTQANNLNQNQWVRLTDDGSIRGSVTLLVGTDHVRQAKVRVALVHDGRVVREVVTDSEGDFMIEKADAGMYSLVAEGENQIAVCALTVLTAVDGRHLPERAHIRSVSPASPRIAELIRGNTMPTWTLGGLHSQDPIAAIRKFEDTCEVEIDAQGGISGTLSRSNASVDLSSTAVYLVRDGREVARTRAASNGSYRFDRVAAGSYGLVASGPEGIAAVGFCAVGSDLVRTVRSKQRLVAQQGAPLQGAQGGATIPAPATTSQHLNVELAEPNCYIPSEIIPVEECVTEAAAACPTMGGCCGGGFGGGGGGGSGSGVGGWGTLAALGALGAIGIIQALDDDDQAPIVSPQ
jgi:hypothetical protein